MPKFSANLGFLFTELPFLDRFAAAAKAGFSAVESPLPYDAPLDQQKALLQENGLEQALINLPAGNWSAGERGVACLPGREDEFRRSIATAIEYATALGCKRVNCLAGLKPEGLDRGVAWKTLVDNLRYAGRELAEAHIMLVVEPINTFDMPGFFLSTSSETLRAIDETGDPHIKLQYDIYHMQRMEGDLANTIRSNMSRIGHVQVAGNPDRTEPDMGEVNCAFLFSLLDDLGYQGWVGAEYKPTRPGDFSWLANTRSK